MAKTETVKKEEAEGCCGESNCSNNMTYFAIIFLFGLAIGGLAGYWYLTGQQPSGGGEVCTAGFADTNNSVVEKATAFITNELASEGIIVKAEGTVSESMSAKAVKIGIYSGTEKLQTNTIYIINNTIVAPIGYDISTYVAPKTSSKPPVTSTMPKSDKPAADLYIFSYCPAGSAALDSFAKAAEVLADSADMNVKFFSNMHGAHELQQNKIQECIQVVDKNNYWKYAQKFVSDIYPNCGGKKSVDCDKTESTKLMDSLGINSTKVFDCVEKQGESLYQADIDDANKLQLQYSPSVVVNEVYFGNADRSPEGLKTLICSAFNTIPNECNTTLSGGAATASGGCS